MSGDLYDESPEPPRPRPFGAILGAVVALVASAGLAWWFGAPRDEPAPAAATLPVAAAPAKPVLTAPARPEEAQVRRAYEAFQDTYADGGTPGVERARQSCAATLGADPRIFDYCLAFDMFAAALGNSGASGNADARRLAEARAALPAGLDPARRIAEVGRLSRLVSLGEPQAPPPAKLSHAEVAAAKPTHETRLARAAASRPRTLRAKLERPKSAKARIVKVKAVAHRARSPVLNACQFEPTAADRLLCANPGLVEADRKMRRAYDDALSSGVDPTQLEADQARWRASRDEARDAARAQELYDQRTRDLQDLTPPH
jgi:uncharacterized protein YecT (DUF1311 family)